MARTLTQPGPDRGNRLIFLGAIGLAAVAAVLIFVALSKSGGDGTTSTSSGNLTVVTASTNISPGTTITADMLGTTKVSSSAAIAGYVTETKSLVGLTTVYPIAQGEQISTSKIVGAVGNTKVSPSYIIPTGKRAFSIQVSQTTSPSSLIVAGDHVDIIVAGTTDTPGGGTDTNSLPAGLALVQDIEVLAVEDTTLKPVSRLDKDGKPIQSDTADGSIATNPDPTTTQTDAKTVTLAVTPEQAQQLAVAQDGYKLYVSLRAPGDDATPLDPNKIIVLPAGLH